MENKALLPPILGCALRGERVPEHLLPRDWNGLLILASRQKVLSTLACALPLLPQRPEDSVCQQLEGELMRQMLVSSNQLYGAQQLQKAFESKGLYNMTLKGIHTKLRYPQDHMRSMGDLDVLCKPEQNAAVKAAMEALGYGGFQPGRKHDHYRCEPYLLVEMHRELVPASSSFSGYYGDIWERSQPLPGCSFSYQMSTEDEYIYNLIHMVQHFQGGGVGLRFIMDVYVYETFVAMDRDYLQGQLDKLKLTAFYQNVVRLAMHWFRGDEGDALTEQMAQYVLSGGVYGSRKHAQANAVSKGGRLRFLLAACFPGYREMCSMYPWLEKWPVALPIAWVMRAVGSLLHRRRNIRSQFETYAKADEAHGQQLREFYRACGLEEE